VQFNIYKKLGKGYAKEHPELICAFMNAASTEGQGSIIGKCILELRDSLDEFNSAITTQLGNIAIQMEKIV
jgi:hypothetical protein